MTPTEADGGWLSRENINTAIAVAAFLLSGYLFLAEKRRRLRVRVRYDWDHSTRDSSGGAEAKHLWVTVANPRPKPVTVRKICIVFLAEDEREWRGGIRAWLSAKRRDWTSARREKRWGEGDRPTECQSVNETLGESEFVERLFAHVAAYHWVKAVYAIDSFGNKWNAPRWDLRLVRWLGTGRAGEP